MISSKNKIAIFFVLLIQSQWGFANNGMSSNVSNIFNPESYANMDKYTSRMKQFLDSQIQKLTSTRQPPTYQYTEKLVQSIEELASQSQSKLSSLIELQKTEAFKQMSFMERTKVIRDVEALQKFQKTVREARETTFAIKSTVKVPLLVQVSKAIGGKAKVLLSRIKQMPGPIPVKIASGSILVGGYWYLCEAGEDKDVCASALDSVKNQINKARNNYASTPSSNEATDLIASAQ